ncbi:hypothetical protein CPC08DRAFT_347512 [Agrocybe pediades]|nr:hypothetical protein CPC08DRAFT_347512 [Agrocybe pediades]
MLSPFGNNLGSRVPDNLAEDDTSIYWKLEFDATMNGSGHWRFGYSGAIKSIFTSDDFEPNILHILLLGYVIFLLPRCGRSDALMATCEEYRMRIECHVNDRFPIRRRLLHKEIDKYLARVLSPTSCV